MIISYKMTQVFLFNFNLNQLFESQKKKSKKSQEYIRGC